MCVYAAEAKNENCVIQKDTKPRDETIKQCTKNMVSVHAFPLLFDEVGFIVMCICSPKHLAYRSVIGGRVDIV